MNTYIYEAIATRVEQTNENSLMTQLKKLSKQMKLNLKKPDHIELAKRALIDNDYRLIAEHKRDISFLN